MFTIAIILELAAMYVAFGNIVGVVSATKEHGYSCVPLISLLFCTIAFLIARDSLGYWLFLPAIIDPGTLVLLLLPIDLIRRRMSGDRS